MAAMSLAAKVCEIPLKLSDVVNTCYRSVWMLGFIKLHMHTVPPLAYTLYIHSFGMNSHLFQMFFTEIWRLQLVYIKFIVSHSFEILQKNDSQ